MKKLFCAFLILIALFSLCSCEQTVTETETLRFTSLEDFAGKNMGIIAGSSLDVYAQEKYGKMNISYYKEETTGIAALQKGTLDAFFVSKSTGIYIVKQQSDLVMFPEPFIEDNIAFAFKKGNPLCTLFSSVIDRYAEDGTLDALEQKWLYGDDEKKYIADEVYADLTDAKSTLTFYCSDTLEPMIYHGKEDKLIGYDAELALLVCHELGYNVTFVPSQLDALIMAIQNGSADFIGGELSITEDRKSVVDFTSPTFHGGLYAVVRRSSLPTANDIDLHAEGVTIAVCIDVDVKIKEYYPNAEIIYVQNESDGLLAVFSGQADAVVEKADFLKTIVNAGITNVHIHSDGRLGEVGKVAAAISPKTEIPDAVGKFNQFLAEIKADGTLEQMENRWLVEKNYTMPEIAAPENPAYTIRVGTTGLATPYTFVQDGELAGLDVELAKRFAAWLGAGIEFTPYGWEGLITACVSGKIDYAISNLFASEEKAESVIFSDPYDTFELVLFVLDAEPVKTVGFFEGIAESFDKTFVREGRWKLILQGLLVTAEISVGAAVLGIVLGSLLCLMHRSKKKWIRKVSDVFCYVISGIPALVTLMIIYFVIFAKTNISPVFSGILTFGLLFGITFSSILSTAIDSVDVSQWEAAKALGFGNEGTFFSVILPQTYKIVLPLFKGEFVSMMKLTSIVGYIAIQDLTKAGDIIRARTFEAFFPLIAVALVYLLLSTVIIFVLGKIEIKTDFATRESRYPKGVNPHVEIAPAEQEQRTDLGKEIIRAEHVAKCYPNATPLRDFNAVIRKGEVISIIGPSGTGKSTFLRMLNRMDRPSAGKIFVFGQDVNDKSTDMTEIRKKMGMVFQSFHLFNHLNVIENIMLAPCKLLNKPKQEAYEDGIRLLRAVGLGEKALNMPAMLSGGQKQRVAIARALAMHPEIILFDEPTSALDPTMVGEVLDVIKGLADTGMTMLIVTHEMRFARDVSTRVFYLDQGELYEDGTPAEIFGAPKRTRTEIFINKLKSAAVTIASEDYDYIATEQTMRAFALKNKISEEATEHLCALVKDVLAHKSLLPAKGDEHKLHLIAEYNAEDGAICVKFIRESAVCDFLAETGEEKALCERAEYAYEDGKNVLTFYNIK